MIKTFIAAVLASLATVVIAEPIRAPFKVDGLWCYGMTLKGSGGVKTLRRAVISADEPGYIYTRNGFATPPIGGDHIEYNVSGDVWQVSGTPPDFVTQHKVAGEKCFKRLFPTTTRTYLFDYPS